MMPELQNAADVDVHIDVDVHVDIDVDVDVHGQRKESFS
jgi:hypothetical protein